MTKKLSFLDLDPGSDYMELQDLNGRQEITIKYFLWRRKERIK